MSRLKSSLNDEFLVVGLFGFPLKHTLSPAMHNAAFRASGIPGIYFAFERNKSRFLKLIRSRKRMILDGFNLTVPYKETILPYLDSMDADAKLTGAVNTVRRVNNRWIGHNTDVIGFRKSLRDAGFSASGKRVVVLGAGGAARAVLVVLASQGARKIVVGNRTVSKAKKLIHEFQKKFHRIEWQAASNRREMEAALQDAHLVVNATSLGLKPADPLPVSAGALPKRGMLVYDLIYRPKVTRFLRLARSKGHRIMNGERMLLYQGARAFELWTGQKAPLNTMKKALHDALRTA